ncbi:MAG TPA: hypothetical protein VEA99_15615 [Gemmatimonadaceae bacterium]|nr:hypothetical protein [Gemmatimonadaceae bacterium]
MSPLRSPLLGLWIAFVLALVACVDGVAAHEIPLLQAVAALGMLALVIRLTSSALRVAAFPVTAAQLRVARAVLREAMRGVGRVTAASLLLPVRWVSTTR